MDRYAGIWRGRAGYIGWSCDWLETHASLDAFDELFPSFSFLALFLTHPVASLKRKDDLDIFHRHKSHGTLQSLAFRFRMPNENVWHQVVRYYHLATRESTHWRKRKEGGERRLINDWNTRGALVLKSDRVASSYPKRRSMSTPSRNGRGEQANQKREKHSAYTA